MNTYIYNKVKTMMKLGLCLPALLLVPLAIQAQPDFKLYFANNVDEITSLQNIKGANSGLHWEEVGNGSVTYSNVNDVNLVKAMFSKTDEKTRADQELFWKMRDRNLLCFRIEDGSGRHGEFKASVRSFGTSNSFVKMYGSKVVYKEMIATNYFFINTDDQSDSLIIKVNRIGCNPGDTLRIKYKILDWDNDDLVVFKLDSRRQKTGLTYTLECEAENISAENPTKTTTTLKLSGSHFQSYYRPKNSNVNFYLVNDGKRLKLNNNRIVAGVNLSSKLNRLYMSPNFNLDKHKNRELTIFNMLGSGLFEQYDTLNLTIIGTKGVIKAKADPETKLAQGFNFNIAEVDANGDYVSRGEDMKMKYVRYDEKKGIHKILTYGNPCYIEVFAAGYYPALFKYAGAVDPKTKILNEKCTEQELRLIPGNATATGPDISRRIFYTLHDEKKVQTYNGTKHKVFTAGANDLATGPSSDAVLFTEDGGYQITPKLLNGKPVEKYAEIGVEYSIPKTDNAASYQGKLKFEEVEAPGTFINRDPSSSSYIDGNKYPTLSRSWYTMRWDMVGVLPNVGHDYKPRLTIGAKDYDDMPLIRRLYIDEKKQKDEAVEEAKEYAFKKSADGEFNGMGCFSFLGNLGKWDIRADNYPGINFSVTPYLEPSKGVFEIDVNFSWGVKRKNDDHYGNMYRESVNENGGLSRTKLKEFDTREHGRWNFGVDPLQHGSTTTVDKDQWFLSEMDDIFKVETTKLGGGVTLEAHVGFGIKLWNNWFKDENAKSEPYLKALEVRLGFGYFASQYWDLTKAWKFCSITAFYNFVAQINLGAGLRSWKYQHSDGLSTRIYGASVDVFGEVKGGGGIAFGTDFEKKPQDEQGGDNQGGDNQGGDNQGGDNQGGDNQGGDNQGGNNQGGDNQGGSEGGNDGGNEGGNDGGSEGGSIIVDDGNAINAPAVAHAPVQRRAYDGHRINKNGWASLALTLRAGFKVKVIGGYTYLFDLDRHDLGWSFMAVAGLEISADLKLFCFGRINPRYAIRGAYYYAYPDDKTNPTIPLYPNYKNDWSEEKKDQKKAPSLQTLRAPEMPIFPISKCVMDGLGFKANPYFLGWDCFVMANNGNANDLNDDRMTEYDVPMTDDKMDKDDGIPMSTEGRYVQNHSVAKEGASELVVYEEMTEAMDNSLILGEPDPDKEIEVSRKMQIAADLCSEFTPERKHMVIAYNPDLNDNGPVAAINTWTEDGATTELGVEDNAVCVWKRGTYSLPPYEVEGATEEENLQNKANMVASGIRAFEGNLVLSVLDKGKWSEPESVLAVSKDDVLTDYQVLMRNDTVLVALTMLPSGEDSLELRYYCKPAFQPVRYVGKEKLNPVQFSLDQVGAMPMIAILNQVDSANCDIYVKQIDMMGRYKNYGTELAIARYNPMSVKIVADKNNERPEDFAVVWKCNDRVIRRKGDPIVTDSTQVMLNCSRIFLRENMTATPYITLGCTADSTYMSNYDVLLEDQKVTVLYTLTDERDFSTYLMRDQVEFFDEFRYTIDYPDDPVIEDGIMPVNLTVYNTGFTPIDVIQGDINDQEFLFDDIFIAPYTSQTLVVDYVLPENFNGLLRAHDVLASFTDSYAIVKASRRGAPLRRAVKSEEEVKKFAAGFSDVEVELLSQTIEGSENKLYLELTDNNGLSDNETVHVGLYPNYMSDVPITSTAEALLKAGDFDLIGGKRKAYVELTVDGLEEEAEVELRARVYNDRVLEALGDEDDITDAVVDNISWWNNLRIVHLLPSELDNVTLLPVVKKDEKLRKVNVEQDEKGVWVSGLESNDFLRVFDAEGMPVYLMEHPDSRLFIPISRHGVYMLSTGQEIVKFMF